MGAYICKEEHEYVLFDFVKNLFEIFKVKYGSTIPYETTTAGSRVFNVVRLNIPQCPTFYSPAIAVKKQKYPELLFLGLALKEGYCAEFNRKILEVHSNFSNSNYLWMTLQNSIGGIPRVICFDYGTCKELEAVMFEIMIKAHELFYSGEYDTSIRPEEEKENWMHA